MDPHIDRARARRAISDASCAAEPDRHLVAFDDHGHRSTAFAITEHPLQLLRILLDVDVFKVDVPPLIVGPGGLRVRSSVLAEDRDHLSILAPWGLTPIVARARGIPPTGSDPAIAAGTWIDLLV